MNIFILDSDPVTAAQLQCDKHVVKMIVESAQMLSTAHRMLDGYVEKRPSKSGKRMVNYWVHPDSNLENTLYKAVHHGHPCTVWTMESYANYAWHYHHFIALLEEYEYRYGKEHKSKFLVDVFRTPPKNIPINDGTQFKLAMQSNPECIALVDPSGLDRQRLHLVFHPSSLDTTELVEILQEWYNPSQLVRIGLGGVHLHHHSECLAWQCTY